MRKMLVVLAVLLMSPNAYADFFKAKVMSVEATSMPALVLFSMSTDETSNCNLTHLK